MVMKTRNAIPVKNIHFTIRGKPDLVSIREIYWSLKVPFGGGGFYLQK